jgi:hypothetical protein
MPISARALARSLVRFKHFLKAERIDFSPLQPQSRRKLTAEAQLARTRQIHFDQEEETWT